MIEILQNIGYKEILVLIAISMGLFCYIPYFRDMFAGRTTPHIFSWFIWTVLTAIGFFGQVSDGAGPGARVTLFSCICSGGVFIFGLFHHGNRQIHAADWRSFLGALLALVLRYLTNDALGSMILITLIDMLGFIPTFRKGRQEPRSETMITYTISGTKFIFALFALDNFTIITILYPASLILMNCSFAFLLRYRRQHIAIS